MDANLGRLTHFGRYQIVRVLGRGAMGVVYEGIDPRLNRPVAIKTILKGHLMDETVAEEYTARFQREAQAVGRLAHPNIVTLHDFGEEGEVAYIVMEFIRGRELASHFEAGDYFDLPTAVRTRTASCTATSSRPT
jgi:serine/threonine-protein kinase